MEDHKKLLTPIHTGRVKSEAAAEEEEEPMSPTARLFHTPSLNCYVLAEMGCKTPLNVQVIEDGVKMTLLKHPRISSKLVFDTKFGEPISWVRTQVNIDDHFIVPDLDTNMDSPDQFVEDYMSNITKNPMDFSKPLWELHILNIKTSKANSVCILRLHHSIGDGISLISLLLACFRKSSDPDAVPTLPIDNKKTKTKIILTQRSNWFLSYFAALLLFFKVLWNTMVDLLHFLVTMIWLKDTNTPLKGLLGVEQNPKRFVHRTFSLDEVRLVKNAMDNMTINDVILGITQAGLARYLSTKHDDKDVNGDNVEKDKILEHIRLRATLIVNIRPTTTIEGLAEKMAGTNSNGKWQWGNYIGYVLLPFHIGLRDDPLDYIREAKATIDRKKKSFETSCTSAITKFLFNTLGVRVTSKLKYRVLFNTTMSFSNVVGPSDEVSFYGHPLVYLAPSVYGLPQALTIHFQSYMNMMTMVLGVDPSVIHNPNKLCDDIVESLQLAKKSIIERKLVKS